MISFFIFPICVAVVVYFIVKSSAQIKTLPMSGAYNFDIVGEASYQNALDQLAGGKTEAGVTVQKMATLIMEKNNPFDPNAVRVDIEGHNVGYLSRTHAARFRKTINRSNCVAPALITGGWKRAGSQGNYGVKLNFKFK